MLTDATTPAYTPPRDALNVTPRAEIKMVNADGAASGETDFSLVGDGEFSFWDFLDVINPLQHIPIVNGIYRELTGDTIKPVMKLAGGALFGGPLGLGLAALDVSVEGATGKDANQHVAAMFEGVDDPRGTAYRLYNEAHTDDALRDNPEGLAKAEAMLAALRRDDAAKIADADANAMVALPALTVVPAGALPEPEPEAADPLALTPWDAPAAATAPAAAASFAAATRLADDGKEFPMPERRHTGAPKPVAATDASHTRPNATVAAPSGLSSEAMAAAGLTPEAVQEVLRAHGQAQAEDAAQAAHPAARPAAKATAKPAPDTADSGEPLWFFDRMNAALDKYRAAQGLSPAAAAAQ